MQKYINRYLVHEIPTDFLDVCAPFLDVLLAWDSFTKALLRLRYQLNINIYLFFFQVDCTKDVKTKNSNFLFIIDHGDLLYIYIPDE